MIKSAFRIFSPSPASPAPVCRVISASGRLKTEHFILLADHLELELNSTSFELLAASAQGNVQVQMASADGGEQYVAHAQSATYQLARKCLTLVGWTGGERRDAPLPADGIFFDAA
jgi:hypothetical protein